MLTPPSDRSLDRYLKKSLDDENNADGSADGDAFGGPHASTNDASAPPTAASLRGGKHHKGSSAATAAAAAGDATGSGDLDGAGVGGVGALLAANDDDAAEALEALGSGALGLDLWGRFFQNLPLGSDVDGGGAGGGGEVGDGFFSATAD